MKKQVYFLLLVSIVLSSCNKSRFKIDLDENRVDVSIRRFDVDLISLDTLNNGIQNLYSQYPDFLPVFTTEIINTPATDTAAVRKLFGQFLCDTVFSEVNAKVMTTFDDVSDIEKEVSDGFTYIHHYFPEVKLPEVYFFVSGFNRQVMMNDRFIAMGTDYYLGKDYKHYKDFTYQYLLYNMRRECLSVDLVSTTLFRIFQIGETQERLLDNMLFRGKVIYLLSVCMPEQNPEMIMGYSLDQINWCQQNEKAIWATMIDHKDLFSTDMLLIRKYMNEAPFTSPISQNSPGRLGTWVGWQIVKNYMDNNKQVGLRDLMLDNNYQKILEQSGYRP